MAERRVYVRGEIDRSTTPGLRALLNDAIADSDTDLAVDCSDITFIDSGGIWLLIDTQRRLQAEGRSLRVVNANPMIVRVLGLAGLVEFLRVEAKTVSGLADDRREVEG
jgi:anti-sigma B factor antagonist